MSKAMPLQMKEKSETFIRKKGKQNAIKYEDIQSEKDINILPTRSLIASLQSRYITTKRILIGTSLLSAIVVIAQAGVIFRLIPQIKDHEIVVAVPGVPEVMKIRPGRFPDSTVYAFAENIADYVGNFNSGNVATHYAHVERYMSAPLAQQFELDWQSQLNDWKQRRLSQIFDYQPASKYELKKDRNGNPFYSTF